MYHDDFLKEIIISDTQEEIISTIIEDRKNFEANDRKGISSARIEKLGINRKTFENNIDFLLQNYLLIVTNEEEHKKQIWIYYDVTPLSYLLLLRKSGVEIVLKRTKEGSLNEFFPYIMRHWEELKKIYGIQIYRSFYSAVKKIDVYLGSHTERGRKARSHRHLEYHSIVNFPSHNISFKNYFFIKKYENSKKTSKKIVDFQDIKKFNEQLVLDTTFQFYLNLFHRKSAIKTKNGHIIEMYINYNKDESKEDFHEYEYQIWEGEQDRIKKTLEIINKDETIRNSLNEKLTQMNSQMDKPFVFNFLLENIKE